MGISGFVKAFFQGMSPDRLQNGQKLLNDAVSLRYLIDVHPGEMRGHLLHGPFGRCEGDPTAVIADPLSAYL